MKKIFILLFTICLSNVTFGQLHNVQKSDGHWEVYDDNGNYKFMGRAD